MSEELKPCPFCGGLAELDTSQAYRALSSGALGSRAVVYCTRCSAEVGFCYEDAPGIPGEDIVNQVVDDWNRRAPSPDMREVLPLDRETLGRMVREAWVRWALTQPAPKPSWLVPYDEMSEPDKEADRQIGEAIAKWTMLHHEARNALADPDMREAVDWQRFDTAPTDGTVILAYRDDAGVFTAHFVEEDAYIATPNNPPQGDAYWFTTSGEDLTNDMPTLWAHVPQPSVAALRSLSGAKP